MHALELPNPYEMILTTLPGERVELPWDFVRHHCDRSYRPMVEAIALRGTDTGRTCPSFQGVGQG